MASTSRDRTRAPRRPPHRIHQHGRRAPVVFWPLLTSHDHEIAPIRAQDYSTRAPGMRAAVADMRKPRQTAGRQLTVGEKDVTSDPLVPPRVPNQGNKWWTRLAQVRRPSGGARRRLRLVVLGVCLCLAIVGVSVAALSSSGGKSSHTAVGIGGPAAGKNRAAAPAPATSPSHAPAAPATTPAVTSHGLAKTVVRLPSGLKGQVRRWKAGPGGAALSAVTQQLDAAAQSAGLRMYHQMKLACVSLDASIQAARAAPPIPDVPMQARYGKALAELSGAAADCQQAISEKPGDEITAIHENETLLNRSRSEFAAGSKTLYEATAAIGALRS